MTHSKDTRSPGDPYDLSRFLQAQQNDYERAFSEIKNGQKRTHWMWYIFPQLQGLAFSATAQLYSIKGIEEARAYLAHPVLGARLLACVEAVLNIEGRSAKEIFGFPDDLKLRSCATLFAQVSPSGSAFERLIEKLYQGEPDDKTLKLLNSNPESGLRL